MHNFFLDFPSKTPRSEKGGRMSKKVAFQKLKISIKNVDNNRTYFYDKKPFEKFEK